MEMDAVFFVSDLHGEKTRYSKLSKQILHDRPAGLFIGGDITPHFARFVSEEDFFEDLLFPEFRRLKTLMGRDYPEVFIILGNDDPRSEEMNLLQGEEEGLWHYMQGRKRSFGDFTVYGYACIPPTPFRLKDWERYDVSRYVDPGCVPPTEGIRTVDTGEDLEYCTIQQDLVDLAGEDDLARAIFLFHAPPYRTNLDRAALDGLKVEHVPLDTHVGSIAIQRFIEERKPMITFHGHVHESARLTGYWFEKIGATFAFNAAIEEQDLAVIKLDLCQPEQAIRLIL